MGIARVRSESVWQSVRIVFIGSALLFLINIYFGFANAFSAGSIERQQILIHLHAGSVGWITLSVIGLGIWLVTGTREVSRAYERGLRALAWGAVLVFAAYIPNFWLAFMGAGSITVLLPTFGSAAVVILWITAIFMLVQLRRQAEITTIYLLVSGALLVAAIGATVGALLGLERVIGAFLPLPVVDRTGAHAGMMDTYLFLAAAAIVEWIVRPASAQRWSWAGVVQAAAWTIGATLVPVAFFLGAVEQLLPIFGILLLLGLALFLVRVAWRAILVGPVADGVKPWAFFGTGWLVAFMGLFLMAVGSGDFESLPSWFGTAFVHAGFVGMMTNLLFGVHSARAQEERRLIAWGEPTAMWLMNLGILAFIGLKVAADIRVGALVMGVGVLMGVATLLVRLRASGASQRATNRDPAAIGG